MKFFDPGGVQSIRMTIMDRYWLERCQAGDEYAIEKLVYAHQKDVYRLALSILDDPDEAEDGTQETFLAALRALDSFRGDSSFKTWLFSIAVNVCRSRLRRRGTRERISRLLQGLFHSNEEEGRPERVLLQSTADTELWNAVRALSEKHRTPVMLRYYHDLPIADIAAMLKVPLGTIHSRLNHARGQLRSLLKKDPR